MVDTVTRTGTATSGDPGWIRKVLGVIGVVFLLVGIWGFFDSSPLGFFSLTATHNWVHLLTGLLYAWVGFAPVDGNVAAWVARIGGIVYALLGVVGFVASDLFAPFLVLGFEENVFHLVVGALIAVLGFMIPTETGVRERARRPVV